MTNGRIRVLMKRAGLRVGPLAHVRTVAEYEAAIAKLTDAELLDEYEDGLRAWARTLSDDQLLTELQNARLEAAGTLPNDKVG